MKTISLLHGQIAQIDDEDFERVSQYKWYLHNYGYVQHTYYDSDGKSVCVLLHRLVMNAPQGITVDHCDLDKLNNQKSNLRLATQQQNTWNAGRRSHNVTGFKGVCLNRGRYRASIGLNNKNIYLGSFSTPEAAARVYDDASRKYHGVFGLTNEALGLL